MFLSSLSELKERLRAFSCGARPAGIGRIAAVCFTVLLSGTVQPLRSEITIASYHLRDRAIVTDSLLMRKRMIFSFKSSRKLSELKGCAAVGEISHQGQVMARDTAYFFDDSAANLGFGLPYQIPDGIYHLTINVISTGGKVLDTYTGDFERSQLRPYFNRAISFWDFTTPYAHLQCSGYGYLNYKFDSRTSLGNLQSLELSARMTSDSRFPARVCLSLNGLDLGMFDLPAGDNRSPKIVTWRVENREALAGLAVNRGENHLRFSISREQNPQSMGIRIYSDKNVRSPHVEEAVPIRLKLVSGDAALRETVFSIPVWGEEGEHITSKLIIPGPESFTEEKIETDQKPLPLTGEDIQRGYVVFSRNCLRYVYHHTVPAEDERVDSLRVRMGRNDFEPLTISIYPVRELGEVRLSVGELEGPAGGIISPDKVQVHVVKTVKVRSGRGTGYRLIPRMLERTDRACIPMDYTTRFWLTVHADNSLAPGLYRGRLRIEPGKEQSTDIPLTIEVLPISLEPVPGIAYNMFMSYEFFEMESKDLTGEEREKVYLDGVNVFRDFKNHGMTTVDVATPYYFQWNRDGSPRMEHFKAMLRAAREVGFSGPLFWYFAHYVQAAKAFHPGNVRTYDPKIHPKRAAFLVKTAQRLVKELDGPPVYFVPIDEPRIASRQKITVDLLKAVKKVRGVKTMSSTDIGGKLLDIENNSQSHRKRLGPGEKVRKSEREVWEYNNGVISSLNPGYSRYIYGYYTWRQDLDGMNSWGFNTAENSRGHPYEDLDHERSDWNLAYPHPGGPLPTPNWEALREGIDDVRYLYQLEKLAREKAASHPEAAAEAGKFLDEIRSRCDIDERKMYNDFGEWPPEAFDTTRNSVISWILKLQKL